ncbi:cytochrome P450 4C1-like [Ctenocephalides felis]|uniref:cytochrome P450 4C1-like n=1 Tax=Ctenocephalides felis TaxID=7515 RepID=UPI000E6E1A87|nr:cytochrome P450 4C1-like [Ctenocephalides felis]
MKWRNSRSSLYRIANKFDGPALYPIIGNALLFAGPRKEILNKMIKIHTEYRSSPIRLWFAHRLLLVFTDADQVEKILLSSKLTYKDAIYDPLKVMVGDGLITGSGIRARLHRKILSPMLSPKNINGYVDIFEKHTEVYIKQLEEKADGQEFDIYWTMSRLCSDIVFDSIMDYKVSKQETEEFLSNVEFLYDVVIERLVKIWMQTDAIFKLTPIAKRYYKSINEYINFFKKLLKTKQEELKAGITSEKANKSPSTVEQLLRFAANDPDAYTDKEILDEILTLYAAAQDTTASICSFVLIMLGAYPEAQEKLYQEVNQIHFNRNTTMTTADVAQLTYTDMVIKEVIRLFPIAPYLVRTCSEDVLIDDDITIPANCSVVLGIFDLHHQSKHWEHPWEFYPEHFFPEAVANRHPSAYLPFSYGTRSCLGKTYALSLIKVAVARIVQRFKIVADKKVQDLHLHNDISVRSTDGYKIKLLLRE